MMKSGDLMADLRKVPPGKPFAVQVGAEVLTGGRLVDDKDGVFLVFEAKAKAKAAAKKPRAK